MSHAPDPKSQTHPPTPFIIYISILILDVALALRRNKYNNTIKWNLCIEKPSAITRPSPRTDACAWQTGSAARPERVSAVPWASGSRCGAPHGRCPRTSCRSCSDCRPESSPRPAAAETAAAAAAAGVEAGRSLRPGLGEETPVQTWCAGSDWTAVRGWSSDITACWCSSCGRRGKTRLEAEDNNATAKTDEFPTVF